MPKSLPVRDVHNRMPDCDNIMYDTIYYRIFIVISDYDTALIDGGLFPFFSIKYFTARSLNENWT